MPYLLMLLVVLSVPAAAHESDDPDHAQAHLIPAAVERNVVEIKAVGDVLVITSNGIPNHTTGQFPNRGQGERKPSYQLKSGFRPSGPGGRYDGTYTADFEYRAGSGDLDQCNGADVNGEYVYFVTEAFPFAPRCLMGVVNSSFSKRGGGSVEGQNRRQRPPSGLGHRRPPPHF